MEQPKKQMNASYDRKTKGSIDKVHPSKKRVTQSNDAHFDPELADFTQSWGEDDIEKGANQFELHGSKMSKSVIAPPPRKARPDDSVEKSLA